jgi:hypothetical protein
MSNKFTSILNEVLSSKNGKQLSRKFTWGERLKSWLLEKLVGNKALIMNVKLELRSRPNSEQAMVIVKDNIYLILTNVEVRGNLTNCQLVLGKPVLTD